MLSHLLWTDPSTFEKGIDNIQSNLRPEDTLVRLTLGGRKIAKNWCTHRVTFLVWSSFLNFWNQVVYFCCTVTLYPLSDRLNGILENAIVIRLLPARQHNVVIIYGTVFAPGRQGTGSDERLSQLYHALGGIPLLRCSKPKEDSETVC